MKFKILMMAVIFFLVPCVSFSQDLAGHIFTVGNGYDFCKKVNLFLKELNTKGVTTTDIDDDLFCVVSEDGWISNDEVHLFITYRHQKCDQEEKYFRIVKLTYEGIYYSDQIKEIIEEMGFKFIAQTEDSPVTKIANGGTYQLSIGIPRCQEIKE